MIKHLSIYEGHAEMCNCHSMGVLNKLWRTQIGNINFDLALSWISDCAIFIYVYINIALWSKYKKCDQIWKKNLGIIESIICHNLSLVSLYNDNTLKISMHSGSISL